MNRFQVNVISFLVPITFVSVPLFTLRANAAPNQHLVSGHSHRPEKASMLPVLTGWNNQHSFGISEQAPGIIGSGGINLPLGKSWSVEYFCTGAGRITLSLSTASHSSLTGFITSPCDGEISYAQGSVVHAATMLIPSAPSNVEFEVAAFVGIWNH